ncbi:MAG: hypothetical protein JWR61_1069, partial [Ferruginibacter sp.]|uniref:gliding motility-associated C-terminal domain-containing protein n=1 Tax=Ferruginibacter sp. TaxID=1940288 RepID=UPI0026598C99
VDPGDDAYVVKTAQYGYAQVLFISQFDASNRLTWSTRIEGNADDDLGARVCTDRVGNICLAGNTRSSNYPLVNAGGYYNPAAWGAVVTKFNPARQMTWSTYFPYPYGVDDVTADDSCNLYVVTDKTVSKFDSSTRLVYEKVINTDKMYFWNKINYDPVHDQLQLLGVMNESYAGFPAINTACNGSFFYDGSFPQTYNNATGPIFGTMGTNGEFSYLSLADWVYEYYDQNEMAIDAKGDPVYLFCYQQDGYTMPNPQLTNPGNGAYFDSTCCYLANSNSSALLLKLNASDLSVKTKVQAPVGCSCNGTVAVTTQCGVAPFKYLWSNGDTLATAKNLCAGNYWVKVTDANNLSSIAKFVIDPPLGSISSAITVVTPENCNLRNGTIQMQTVQGGTAPFSYSLDGTTFQSSSSFTGLSSKVYNFYIKDVNGCLYTDTLSVSNLAGPSAVTYEIKKSSCIASDGQIKVTGVTGGSGTYHFNLSDGQTNSTGIFTNLAAKTYQLEVIDSAGCPLMQTVVVANETAASDATYVIANDHCKQAIGSIQVSNVTGGMAPYTFSIDSINFNAGPVKQLQEGSYNLYIRDANGCVLKKSPLVVANEAGPTILTLTTINAYCGSVTGNIKVTSLQGGSAPYLYSVDNGVSSETGNFTGLQPGIHTTTVQDAYGCKDNKSVEILYKFTPSLKLAPADTTVCFNETVTLRVTGDVSQLTNISWDIPAQGAVAAIKVTGNQQVQLSATDTNGCVITATSLLKAKACNTAENCIAIPAAFTPNGDGINDKVAPIINGCRIDNISFVVFNRYGEAVFEMKNPGKGWDGIYKGTAQPDGAYVYQCTYTSGGVTIYKKGTFVLIR